MAAVDLDSGIALSSMLRVGGADALVVESWHAATPEEMAGIYQRETNRWRECLAWETEATWQLIEQHRRQQTLPGVIVRDAAGRLRGWGFYLRSGETLQVGAVHADAPDVTAALLQAVPRVPEAKFSNRCLLFAFPSAAELDVHLAREGFAAASYRYLQRDLLAGGAEDGVLDGPADRGWTPHDLAAVAGVLQRAYARPDPLRPFGGSGRLEDWVEYATQLVTTSGCGHFLPRVSALEKASDGALAALAIVTDLGGGTAHLAQLAVAPEAQGAGLGDRLLDRALAAAARHGFQRMTLLVNENNQTASRLYTRHGFTDRARFISASRPL